VTGFAADKTFAVVSFLPVQGMAQAVSSSQALKRPLLMAWVRISLVLRRTLWQAQFFEY